MSQSTLKDLILFVKQESNIEKKVNKGVLYLVMQVQANIEAFSGTYGTFDATATGP